jgi:hypothetical protein
MSRKLTFPYQLPPGDRGRPVLGNARYYPLLPFRLLTARGKTKYWEALVDSGADSIILPRYFAEAYDLPRTGPVTMAKGIGGISKARPTRIRLFIGRGGREDDLGEVDAMALIDDVDVPILFGRKPLFESYEVIFNERQLKFHLIPFD